MPYHSVKMHGTSCLVQSYGSEGLQLVEHEETVSCGQAVLQLTFDPGVFGHTPVTARCQLDHPFYVKNKGTSTGDEQYQWRLPMKSLFKLFPFSQDGPRFTQA